MHQRLSLRRRMQIPPQLFFGEPVPERRQPEGSGRDIFGLTASQRSAPHIGGRAVGYSTHAAIACDLQSSLWGLKSAHLSVLEIAQVQKSR